MSLVIAPIVNKSNVLAVIYLNFLRKSPGLNVKVFLIPNLELSQKLGKVIDK